MILVTATTASHFRVCREVVGRDRSSITTGDVLMHRLCLNRSCGHLWSRPSPSQFSQVRLFQSALRVSPQDGALHDFTYRALLVDAAGTLLIPSEPAAEVMRVSLQLWLVLPLSIS